MYSPKLRQPARAARRSGFFVARAPCLSLKIRKDASRRPPPRGQTRCNRWLQETVVGWVPHCCGIVIYNECRNFNVSPRNWTRTAARDCGLRRQQDLAAGGRQIGHPQPRLGLRRRRRPPWEPGVGDPMAEFPAAAVVARSRGLRLAVRTVGGADEPNVEVKVVPPPRLHLAEPMAVAAGVAAQGFLDRRVHEDAG